MHTPIQDISSHVRSVFIPMSQPVISVPSSLAFSFWSEQDFAIRLPERTAHMPDWFTGSASVIMATDALLRWIDDLYIVTDRKAVREFVHAHPDLAGLLVEAYEPLVEAFGPFPRVQLSVVRDPEIEDRVELLGAILTPLSVDEAMAGLEQFDERWFLQQIKQVKGLLAFDLEFV